MDTDMRTQQLHIVACVAGLALLLTADWCSNLIAAPQLPAGGAAVSLVGRACAVVAFIACAARPAWAHRAAASTRAAIAMPCCLACGALMQTYAGALPATAALPMALVGAAAFNAAQALLLLHWLATLCACEPRTIAAATACAYTVPGLSYFVLAALPPVATTALLALLPAASGGIFLAYQHNTAPATTPPATHTAPGWTFPLYPVALMVIFKFVFYFSLSLTSGPSMFGPLAMLLVATGTAAVALFAYDRFRASTLYKLALPCMVAGLLFVAWVHVGNPAATLAANAGNIAFELFIIISLAESCHRFHIEPYWMFGIVQAASSIAGGCGFNAGIAFTAAWPAGSPESNVLMCAVVVALVAASALFFNERVAGASFGTERTERTNSATQAQSQELPAALTYQEELERRCDRLARTYDLSRRETEILELLAQGMSSARIEEQLVISRNTVKSHTRHIYEKLGVHSRDEARALVETNEDYRAGL